MKARQCFICRLLAKAYEAAKRNSEKCAICACIAFLLAMPLGACAAETEHGNCIEEIAASAAVPDRVIVQLPNMPFCWLFTKLTGRDPPTPRTFAIALANGAASASGVTIRFR